MSTTMARQAITGLTPPEVSEIRIREKWPSVQRFPAVAGLGVLLTRTIILAPVAWLLMAPFFFGKVLPFLMRRYMLTNRRVVIRKGWTTKVVEEIALADIDDVRVVTDGNSTFYRAASLEFIKNGQVAMTMGGVGDAESFRQAILAARNAWVPGKAKTQPFISSSATK